MATYQAQKKEMSIDFYLDLSSSCNFSFTQSFWLKPVVNVNHVSCVKNVYAIYDPCRAIDKTK